jgi:hypothetical protein
MLIGLLIAGCGIVAPLRWALGGTRAVVRVGAAVSQQTLSLLGRPLRRVVLEGGRTLLVYALDEGAETTVRLLPVAVQAAAAQGRYRGLIEILTLSNGTVESVQFVPLDGATQGVG